jgi:serine/threonine-protein kinase
VIRLLDEGGMAKLYLAERLRPDGGHELVVIKQVRSFIARDAELRRMFLEEARLSERLRHPNVVHTHGAIDEGGALAMVMEYLDGQSLARIREQLLGEQPALCLALSLHVLAEAAAGLQYAHELEAADGTRLSIVHRDVSPQNLLLTYDGRVKVVDFGLARDAQRTSHDAPTPFKGKLTYAAPEQVAGGRLDARTDLFSLGVMLWEVLAGRRLWQGMDNAEIHARLLRHAWPALHEVSPEADRELVALCASAMQGRSEARLASAAQFRERLLSALCRLGLELTGESAGKQLAAAFAEEREELRVQIAEYFAGATAESGFYPASL